MESENTLTPVARKLIKHHELLRRQLVRVDQEIATVHKELIRVGFDTNGPEGKAEFAEETKKILLCLYASGILCVAENDTVDITTKKLMARLEEIDRERAVLRRERDAITTALSVAGWRPSGAHNAIYTHEENEYSMEQSFRDMSLIDACLKVLRDHADKELHEQWLDKNQVEFLVTRGGYQFKADDPTNSVNISLRKLAARGFCEAHVGKGSRSTRYHFRKERLPNDVEDSGATNGPKNSGSGQR